MPPLTRWMVKTSLVYLVLALISGILLGMRTALSATWVPSGLTPAYFHLYMVGWVTLMIFGIVYWMFPKFTMAGPRGSDWLGWAVYVLLNMGLILRVAGESFIMPGSRWGWVLVISALLQWLGGFAFVVNTWQRVKEK